MMITTSLRRAQIEVFISVGAITIGRYSGTIGRRTVRSSECVSSG